MPNTSIDGFSVLSPSQRKELERQRQEEEARKAAKKAEETRKSQEASRRAQEAAQKERLRKEAEEAKRKAKEEEARQTAIRKKAAFWIIGFALTFLYIWGVYELGMWLIDLSGGTLAILVLMGWVFAAFGIVVIWGLLEEWL